MGITVTWHGHANFQIAGGGVNILIDPFFTGNPAAVISYTEAAKPDLVLVTHMHGDHVGDAVSICTDTGAMLGCVVGAAERLEQAGLSKDQILNGIGFNIGGALEYKGARITMTQAFHTSEAGCPVGYIITMPDGYTVYHAGDTGIFSSMSLWGELYDIDLALLPAGGCFTMDQRQAALAAKLLRAKKVVPMHWGTFPVLAQSMDGFPAELAGASPASAAILMRPGETMTL